VRVAIVAQAVASSSILTKVATRLRYSSQTQRALDIFQRVLNEEVAVDDVAQALRTTEALHQVHPKRYRRARAG
jgi:hypothetical protein